MIRKNNSKKQLYYRPCLTIRDSKYCQQVLKWNTITSDRTGKMFKIFHQLNCKISYFIYLPQCQIYHLQYVRKVSKRRTSFYIRLNNYRKDSKNKTGILACRHFQNSIHEFQRDAKFTLIKKITNTFTTTEQLPLLLKKQEHFWILKLKTGYPSSLNQELNDL